MGSLDAFVAQWGLDTDAQIALLQLEPEQQTRVLRDFKPKPGTRDVTKLFYGFLKSVRNGAASAPHQPEVAEEIYPIQSLDQPLREDVQAFLERWGLDDGAHMLFSAQSPDIQLRIMHEFAPKAGTRNVNGLFRGFVTSVTGAANASQQSEGVEEFCPLQTMEQPLREDVQAFLERWGLDDSAHMLFSAQSPDIQLRIMHEFAPKAGTRNVNSLFRGFVTSVTGSTKVSGEVPAIKSVYANPEHAAAAAQKSITKKSSSAGPALRHLFPAVPPLRPLSLDVVTRPRAALRSHMTESDLDAFIMKWGLDLSAYAILSDLDPNHCARVLMEFAPKPGTRDVNRLFNGFVKSIQASDQHMIYPSSQTWNEFGTSAEPNISYPRGAGSRRDFVDFIGTWGLDTSSQSALMELHPLVRKRVMEQFLPRRGTKDVNRLFQGFIKSVIETMDAEWTGSYATDDSAWSGTAVPTDEDQNFWDAPAYPLAAAKRKAGADADTQQEEIDTFLQTWGLDDECAAALDQQTEDVKRRVLDQFRPKPGTRDVKGLFWGFIKSMMNGGVKRQRLS